MTGSTNYSKSYEQEIPKYTCEHIRLMHVESEFDPVKRKDIDSLEEVQNSPARKGSSALFWTEVRSSPLWCCEIEIIGLSSLSSRNRRADLLRMLKILSGKLSIKPMVFSVFRRL